MPTKTLTLTVTDTTPANHIVATPESGPEVTLPLEKLYAYIGGKMTRPAPEITLTQNGTLVVCPPMPGTVCDATLETVDGEDIVAVRSIPCEGASHEGTPSTGYRITARNMAGEATSGPVLDFT